MLKKDGERKGKWLQKNKYLIVLARHQISNTEKTDITSSVKFEFQFFNHSFLYMLSLFSSVTIFRCISCMRCNK